MNAEQRAVGVGRRDWLCSVAWHSFNAINQRCDVLGLNLWLLELKHLYRINLITVAKFSQDLLLLCKSLLG
jgi:hypothetical protein